MSFQGTGFNSLYYQAIFPVQHSTSESLWISLWTAGTSTTQCGLAHISGAPFSSNNFFGPFITVTKFAAISLGSITTGSALESVSSVATDKSWQHLFHAEYNSASRECFVNGVSRATNTTSIGGQSVDRFLIGMSNNTNPLVSTRWIAEACFGKGVLSAEQIKALAQGANPLSINAQILAYFPLRNSLENLGPRGVGLTQVGAFNPTWRDHPPIAAPPTRRRRLFKHAGRRPFLTIVG